ncbi:uroporphyrinogen-III synthase [Brevibacillus ruminantium]|uniref:Uroporphyrinogen-III synthase n=1 Tax=Brevibacillus ruminantium TaxID=2950604 RepID=A0ABY4WAV8_9BACL|nr:uroporphyrinogen-III synthase [Brevibacillus ruminantium]USG64162.1 uroporphyrinogen-III synthase [Brevibacillus ruminantium]
MNYPHESGQSRPLTGIRLMVTRSRQQARELIDQFESFGGEAYAFPLLKMVPPADCSSLDEAIHRLNRFDWVMFTSVNGVRFFLERMHQLGVSPEKLTGRLAAVGPKTAAELVKHGWEADVIPADYVAEGMLVSLRDQLHPGEHVLLPRADIARKILPQELGRMGMHVTEVDVYQTVIDGEQAPEAAARLRQGQIDVIAFTSSSTVTYFMEAMAPYGGKELLQGVRIACIGPITAQTAKAHGIDADIVAEEYTVEGLIEALIAYWGGNHYDQQF